MNTPKITLSRLQEFDPCEERLNRIKAKLPQKIGITAARAAKAGASFDDLVWVASVMARTDKDIERRLRLWVADCAARVLHIYEKDGTSKAPRDSIVAARQYAREEIGAAARDAARAAAWDAAWAAAWDAARAAARDAARAAARAAAWDAARAAAWAAAWDAARDAAWDAARDAARAAAWDDEEEWQLKRLLAWFSDKEPEDWPLPKIAQTAEAAE